MKSPQDGGHNQYEFMGKGEAHILYLVKQFRFFPIEFLLR